MAERFTETVATEFLNRGDELGDMARAVHYQASMKNILDNGPAALEIASTSRALCQHGGDQCVH